MVMKYHTEICLEHVSFRGFFLHPIRGNDTGENLTMTEREDCTLLIWAWPVSNIKIFSNIRSEAWLNSFRNK